MSKLYAIWAYENYYGGLREVNDLEVVEVKSYEEAEEIARELSIGVMESYGDIQDMMADELREQGVDDESEEWEEAFEDLQYQNVAYEIYEVKETNESLDSLNNKFYHDPEDFIENYCIKED